jgi:hypothetical protein
MGIPVPILMGAGLGAASGLLTGKDPIKQGLIGGATGGIADKFMPAMNGLKAAEAAAPEVAKSAASNAGNFMAPTMPEIGGANLYGGAAPYTGITGSTGEIGANMGHVAKFSAPPAIPNASSAKSLISSSSPAAGGLKVMPGKDGGMFDYRALSLLGGGQSQSQWPSSSSGGMKQANAPSADEIAKLLASVRIPEREKLLNLFWS